VGTFGEKVWIYKNADGGISVRYSEVVEIDSRKPTKPLIILWYLKHQNLTPVLWILDSIHNTSVMNTGQYPEAYKSNSIDQTLFFFYLYSSFRASQVFNI